MSRWEKRLLFKVLWSILMGVKLIADMKFGNFNQPEASIEYKAYDQRITEITDELVRLFDAWDRDDNWYKAS